MIRPVTTLLIRVADLERSKTFYANLLGLRFEQHAPTTCMAKLADLTVVLQQYEVHDTTPAVVFAVDDIEEITERALRDGGSVQRKPYPGPFGTAVLIGDPDGLPLEFAVLAPGVA